MPLDYAKRLVKHVSLSIQPVNDCTPLFHASKPGFLSFGELVDGRIELLVHVISVQRALYILSKIPVLQAIKIQYLK